MLARRLGFLIRLAVCSATVLLFAVPVVAVAATSAVTIADFSFSPSQVTVNAGDTVRWTNNGPSPHTTTSTSGVWDSGTLAPGQTFSFTFTTAGTFAYRCTIHPQMTATIQVVAAAASPSPTVAPTAAPTTAPIAPPVTAPPVAPAPVTSAPAPTTAPASATPVRTVPLPSSSTARPAEPGMAAVAAALMAVGFALLALVFVRRRRSSRH